MASEIWGILVLIGLAVLLYGLCDGLEVALYAAQRHRLLQWQEEGRRSAAMALLIRETPAPFVMTLHVCMTCSGIIAAVCAGVLTVSQGLPWLEAHWPWLSSTWWPGVLALALVITCLTYVMLVFGQLVPRAIAQQHPERVVCWFARPLMALTRPCSVVRTLL